MELDGKEVIDTNGHEVETMNMSHDRALELVFN